MNISILHNLKTKDVLSRQDVENLKEYINSQNPNCSGEQFDTILYDAIKNIISNNLYQFNEQYKDKIIDRVLKKVSFKQKLCINAEEVFASIIALKIYTKEWVNCLTRWVNANQSIIINNDVIDFVLNQAINYNEEIVQYNIASVINRINNSMENDELENNVKQHITNIQSEGNEINELVHHENKNKLSNLINLLGKSSIRFKFVTISIIILFLIIAYTFYTQNTITVISEELKNAKSKIKPINTTIVLEEYLSKNKEVKQFIYDIENELTEELRYKDINEAELNNWLIKRKSLLAEEPYFSTIISISKKYDIDALLMFAITGQEQSFVPNNRGNSRRIANNPFNVYGSWRKYNTNIKDSAEIAARTLIRLSKDKPEYIDPIKWINRKYAEDPNWWRNVKYIYEHLSKNTL